MNMKKYIGSYQDYIREYIEEADIEMAKFFESEVYKDNLYLKENLVDLYITPVLSKKSNREKIIEFTGAFIDSHMKQLSTSGPVHMFTFSDKETSFLYNLFGLSKDKMIQLFRELIQETYYGKLSKPLVGIVESSPHKLLITAMIIDSLQQKGSKNDSSDDLSYDAIIECGEYLMAFAEYPLIYRMFWPTTVQEAVMNYTIEHVANKFKVKKMNNVLELIKYDTTLCVNFYKDKFIEGNDNVYVDFIYRIRNQMKNTFKNISTEYYKNHEMNATQHSKSGKMDDGSLSDQEGYTSNLASVVENTYEKIMASGVSNKWVQIAAQGNQVDEANLRGYINKIFTTKDNRIYQFIENVITAYFMKNSTNTSVGSGEFLNFGYGLYKSIGTSKVPIYRELRGILDYWLSDIINITEYYPKGGTTVSNYSRGIFNYMIYSILYHN